MHIYWWRLEEYTVLLREPERWWTAQTGTLFRIYNAIYGTQHTHRWNGMTCLLYLLIMVCCCSYSLNQGLSYRTIGGLLYDKYKSIEDTDALWIWYYGSTTLCMDHSWRTRLSVSILFLHLTIQLMYHICYSTLYGPQILTVTMWTLGIPTALDNTYRYSGIETTMTPWQYQW